MGWFPLWNSLRIAAISSFFVFFTGIAAAYYVAKLPRVLKGVLDVVLTLPLVLPPTVVGYLLLLLLGPRRPVGGVVPGAVRHEAGDDLVVGHLRHLGGGLSPDVPHRPGRL